MEAAGGLPIPSNMRHYRVAGAGAGSGGVWKWFSNTWNIDIWSRGCGHWTLDTGAIILPSSPPDIFAVSGWTQLCDAWPAAQCAPAAGQHRRPIHNTGQWPCWGWPLPAPCVTRDTWHITQGEWAHHRQCVTLDTVGSPPAMCHGGGGRVLPVTGPVAASCHSAGITALKERRPILAVNPRLGGNV